MSSYDYIVRRCKSVRLAFLTLFSQCGRSSITQTLQWKGLEAKGSPQDTHPGDFEDYVFQRKQKLNWNTFTYHETHTVLKDGRIVGVDPLKGKWGRRPAGIAKGMWQRLPHMREALHLLGPDVFTVDELRGASIDAPSPAEVPTGLSTGGEQDGLDDLAVSDYGPSGPDGSAEIPVVDPSSSSSGLPAGGEDLKSTTVMNSMSDLKLDDCSKLRIGGINIRRFGCSASLRSTRSYLTAMRSLIRGQNMLIAQAFDGMFFAGRSPRFNWKLSRSCEMFRGKE